MPATRRSDHDLRISHIGYRPQAHHGDRQQHAGFRCRRCARPRARAASARSRRASTARRPTAATASPSTPTARRSSRAAATTRSTPRCWCRTARSATRPQPGRAPSRSSNGIPTVVMGCAKDIVEHCGVPRFLFSDFPLGNAAGQAARSGVAGADAGTRAARAGVGARPAHHDAVAAALERGRTLEARLQQHRADRRRRRSRAGAPSSTSRRRSRRQHRATRRSAVTAGAKPLEPAFRRREDSRLHAGAGRPLWQLPARAARRRRHQGRAARGRGHAPTPLDREWARRAWRRPAWRSTATSAA